MWRQTRLMKIFLWPGMKIDYSRIQTSISRKLNWTSEEYQLDGALRLRYAIWAPPAVSRGKTAGRFMLFRHLKYAIPDFLLQLQEFWKATLRRYPRVNNILNAEFRESVEDFNSCMTLFHSNGMLGEKWYEGLK